MELSDHNFFGHTQNHHHNFSAGESVICQKELANHLQYFL